MDGARGTVVDAGGFGGALELNGEGHQLRGLDDLVERLRCQACCLDGEACVYEPRSSCAEKCAGGPATGSGLTLREVQAEGDGANLHTEYMHILATCKTSRNARWIQRRQQ